MAEPGTAARIEVPPVPSNLAVPAGHSVFFHGYAVGTQNYICLPEGSGVAWKLFGPQATLFQTFRGEHYQVATHFLSDNPSEIDTLRPTWQHSFDTSRVWAKARASSNRPGLRRGGRDSLAAARGGRRRARPRGRRPAHANEVHPPGEHVRGVAPSTGCSEPGRIGDLALVPYTTDYFFYRAARER
jgi:Protein of unknown function (DUF3455)